MNKLAKLLNKNDEQIWTEFHTKLKPNINTWSYFVDWQSVRSKVESIEVELNILNSLIGVKNLKQKLTKLILQYPNIVKTFPILLAIRAKSVQVLVDTENFIYRNFDFEKNKINKDEAEDLADFVISSGLGEMVSDKKLKNFVDYVLGVEVGIQTNARKNRTGKLMEAIVENFILKTCNQIKADYLPQATKQKIKEAWDIDIHIEKSNRKIDFAIFHKQKLFFIETNFYAGGGSKLKSTAGEYISMAQFWQQQDIEFIWVTDGYGWKNTLKPLREYFDKGYFLLNLEMLKKYLTRILNA